MKKIKIKKVTDFTKEEKIKKFDLLYKKVSNHIKNIIEREYGFSSVESYVYEDTIEIFFGKKMFKVLDEDNRGEYEDY